MQGKLSFMKEKLKELQDLRQRDLVEYEVKMKEAKAESR